MVRDAMLAAEVAHAAEIAATHPAHRRSAANLVHYLELRHHDVRDLQARLAAAGLSSLGRSEAHVLATVEEVLSVLARLSGHEPPERAAGVALSEGHEFLAANAKALLGTSPGTRATRIMVTLPTNAADDPNLVTNMTESGMDIARVNCAHDGPEIWQQMIGNVRSTRRSNGHRPRVAMDLAGPKLRTGPLHPGPRVVRVSPRRDRLGVVTAPALVRLTAEPTALIDASRAMVVPVDDASWIERRQPGDRLEFVDSRGAARHWIVIEVTSEHCLTTATPTAYVSTGIRLLCSTDGDAVTVGDLPEVEQVHRVDTGDHLTLTRSMEPTEPTAAGSEHRIGCTLPEAFDQAKPGERVWLDDGKIGGSSCV